MSGHTYQGSCLKRKGNQAKPNEQGNQAKSSTGNQVKPTEQGNQAKSSTGNQAKPNEGNQTKSKETGKKVKSLTITEGSPGPERWYQDATITLALEARQHRIRAMRLEAMTWDEMELKPRTFSPAEIRNSRGKLRELMLLAAESELQSMLSTQPDIHPHRC